MAGHLRLLSDAAKAVDARSTRSRQKKVGASEIGVCRRRAGYKHHGTKVSDPENLTGLPAVLGTWVHKGALDTMRREWGAVIETRLENAFLRGHADALMLPNDWRAKAGLPERVDAPDVVIVDDLKTKRDARMVDVVRIRGPKRSELFQAHLYGGMLRRGEWGQVHRNRNLIPLGPIPVERIQLRFFPRTGEENAEFVHDQPFDEDIEAEALEWVDQVVRSESPEQLPRDEDGPGLSISCDYCPFMTECWGAAGDHAPQSLLVVTDADLAATLRDYDRERAIERAAKQAKDLARAKLDGRDPAIYQSTAEQDAFRLTWSGGNPLPDREEVDMEAVEKLYDEAGLTLPMKSVPGGTSARTIGVTPWDPPEPLCEKPVGDPPVEQLEEEGKPSLYWSQDRARGGWTSYAVPDRSHVQSELTAGQFAKRFPDYVEPRPGCIHKKGHSGDCVPPDAVAVLDDEPDFGDSADNDDLRAV